MDKKILAYSTAMKHGLDDDYTLYDNGEILHEYDANHYPNGYNRKRILKAEDLKPEVIIRLVEAADENNKRRVREILGIA